MSGWRWRMRPVALMAAAWMVVFLGAALAESAPRPTLTPPPHMTLTREVYRLQTQMAERDRSADTPIYRIDAERFVSEQDVQDYLGLMVVGAKLKRLRGEDSRTTIKPSEEYVRDLLIDRMLLEAEAAALGIDDLRESFAHHMRTGWMEEEGIIDPHALLVPEGKIDMAEQKKQIEDEMNAPTPTPHPTDTETLVRDGWVRNHVAITDMWSSKTSKRPYEHRAALIDELIESLKLKSPSVQEAQNQPK